MFCLAGSEFTLESSALEKWKGEAWSEGEGATGPLEEGVRRERGEATGAQKGEFGVEICVGNSDASVGRGQAGDGDCEVRAMGEDFERSARCQCGELLGGWTGGEVEL